MKERGKQAKLCVCSDGFDKFSVARNLRQGSRVCCT